jgi:adenosylcobinamide-GDP ribazoletransferase
MRAALAFLTPLGRATVPDRRTLSWFPLVGALLGLVVGGTWWTAERLWPPVGAYGVVVALVVVLLRVTALASLEPDVLMIAGAWCGSRTVMAVVARALPYARLEGGLATALLGGDWRPVGLYGLIAAVSLGALAGGRQTELAVAIGMAAGVGVALVARRRLGGFTGDVLGAAGIVTETVALLVAAARW